MNVYKAPRTVPGPQEGLIIFYFYLCYLTLSLNFVSDGKFYMKKVSPPLAITVDLFTFPSVPYISPVIAFIPLSSQFTPSQLCLHYHHECLWLILNSLVSSLRGGPPSSLPYTLQWWHNSQYLVDVQQMSNERTKNHVPSRKVIAVNLVKVKTLHLQYLHTHIGQSKLEKIIRYYKTFTGIRQYFHISWIWSVSTNWDLNLGHNHPKN